MKRLSAFATGLAIALAGWGCEEQVVSPAGPEMGTPALAAKPSNKKPYKLTFTGDIQATDVDAKAVPGANLFPNWSTMEITEPFVDVTLPAALVPENQGLFKDIHWPPSGGPDPSVQNLFIDFPYCTYSEADPFAFRQNTWGGNAQVWPQTKVTLAYNVRNVRGARIDLEYSVGRVAARDTDATVAADTLFYKQGQALVSAGSPDPHTDPCISVTIIAQGPL